MRSRCPFLPFAVIQVTPSKADGALLLFPWSVISELEERTRSVRSAVACSRGDGLTCIQSTAYELVQCHLDTVLDSENGYFKSDASWLRWLIL